MTKICNICNTEKALSEFNKNKSYKDGYVAICKSCRNSRRRELRAQNLDAYNKVGRANYYKYRDTILEQRKKKYISNAEEIKSKVKEYRKTEQHKVCRRKYESLYQKTRMLEDPQYRMRTILRGRVGKFLTGEYKRGKAVEEVGCSIAEFKKHLEAKFKDGMTWDNYGKNGWELDHIIPLIDFDLTDEVQYKKAAHYSNIQPLWNKENLAKGASNITDEGK